MTHDAFFWLLPMLASALGTAGTAIGTGAAAGSAAAGIGSALGSAGSALGTLGGAGGAAAGGAGGAMGAMGGANSIMGMLGPMLKGMSEKGGEQGSPQAPMAHAQRQPMDMQSLTNLVEQRKNKPLGL